MRRHLPDSPLCHMVCMEAVEVIGNHRCLHWTSCCHFDNYCIHYRHCGHDTCQEECRKHLIKLSCHLRPNDLDDSSSNDPHLDWYHCVLRRRFPRKARQVGFFHPHSDHALTRFVDAKKRIKSRQMFMGIRIKSCQLFMDNTLFPLL